MIGDLLRKLVSMCGMVLTGQVEGSSSFGKYCCYKLMKIFLNITAFGVKYPKTGKLLLKTGKLLPKTGIKIKYKAK